MGFDILEKWRKSALGEIIELKYGFGLTERNRKGGNVPVYGSSGVVGWHNEAKVKGPGIIVGRKGSVGAVYFSKSDFCPIDTTYYVEPKNTHDIRFIYYLLKAQDFLRLNSDSAVPGLNRNAAYTVEVLLPPLDEQRRIASILGVLDDKIELNNQMNRTLGEMAQVIFKSWFVDFEPFQDGEFEYSEELGKEIPKGWGVKPIDAIADFLNGLALQKYPLKDDNYLPVIKIREMRQGITESSDRASSDIDKRYIVDDGDILFSWSGSLEVCIWCSGKGALNQHLFKVTSQTHPKWFYYLWIKFYLPKFRHIAKEKATTMGHIRRHHLSETFVIIPPKEVIEKMDNIITPLIENFINNNIESRQLANLRDTLLPKLLSGEIRVNVNSDNTQNKRLEVENEILG